MCAKLFVFFSTKLLQLSPHNSGRRYSQAENGRGTMPFILMVAVKISCVRDEYTRLSVFNVKITRDVNLTYLSGRGGRLSVVSAALLRHETCHIEQSWDLGYPDVQQQ